MCIRDSIEIYVDGIATMQIQNLNALVDTVRHEIIERYRPGEDDPHLKVLQAAQISDDEYFRHMVLDDLNLIIRDIRESHKKDSESAHQTTVADELKENLEAVENFKGSRLEKLAVLYCKQLGINYKNCLLYTSFSCCPYHPGAWQGRHWLSQTGQPPGVPA